MLIILVDLIERILDWLKSFLPQKENSNIKKAQILPPFLASSQSINNFNYSITISPVISRFHELFNDPNINTEPKVNGAISDMTGSVIIGPVKANQAVWLQMFSEYGSQYFVKTF